MQAKRALIVVTSNDRLGSTGKRTGWYLSEVTHVYYPLVEAGYAIDFASPQGGAAPMDESSRKLDDPDNARFLGDAALAERLRSTIPLAEIDPAKYDVIHFAGGHGVVVDKKGKETFMKMGSVGLGIGLGVKDFRALFVFTDKAKLDAFIEKGWDFSGQADAAAKSNEKGASGELAANIAKDVTIYQLTKNGLALQATLQGTKYWRDKDLN